VVWLIINTSNNYIYLGNISNTYNTITNSCVTKVKECLGEAGVSTSFFTRQPHELKEEIKQKVGHIIKTPNIPERKKNNGGNNNENGGG